MITCPSCGHQNPPGSRFCNACGSRVVPADDQGLPAPPVARPPAPPPPALAPDVELIPGAHIGSGGRYVVERSIGQGGFGQAYLVRDQQLGRFCVAKRQVPNPAWSERIREQAYSNFRREAKLLTTLNTPGHPNIPEIFEYLPELHCLVMKYVEGRDLGWVLHGRGGKLPLDEALAIIREVCSALAYMHSRSPEPVLHRDIKPSNILIDSAGRVWVIDFGLSKATPVESSLINTAESQMAGTFGFTPPEQWRGEAVPRSDIYALCATLHLTISGFQPTMDRDDMDDFLAGTYTPFPPVRSIDPSIPPLVEAIIRKGMAFDPAQRPTAAQLLAAFDSLLNPNARADLQAPDGAALADEAALAHWAEAHWDAAALWLYGSLADQVTRLWGKNRLAADMRAITERNATDQHAGLDDLLVLLDPDGYAAVVPQLTADRQSIDFGQLGSEDRREVVLQLSNNGRRYVRVEILVPRWVLASTLTVALPPGRQQRIRITADMRRTNESGRLRETLVMRDRSGTSFQIGLEARLSRWGAMLQMISGARRVNWEGGEIRQIRQIVAHRSGVWALDLSPDGRQIASGGWDQRVRLWRTADGAAEAVLDDHGGNVLSVAYSHDGRFLLAGGNSDQIKLWAIRNRRIIQMINSQQGYQESIFFSSDGQLMIAHGGDGTIGMWRLHDGSLVQRLQPNVGGQTISLHPDGRSVAIGCADSSVRLWTIGEQRESASLTGQRGGINCMVHSQSGGILVVGDGSGGVRIWDLDTHSVRQELRGHQNAVRSVAIHPDGQTVVSAAVDSTIRIWRVSDGATMQILNGHAGSVLRVAFSHDGDMLISGGVDGTIRIWQ